MSLPSPVLLPPRQSPSCVQGHREAELPELWMLLPLLMPLPQGGANAPCSPVLAAQGLPHRKLKTLDLEPSLPEELQAGHRQA